MTDGRETSALFPPTQQTLDSPIGKRSPLCPAPLCLTGPSEVMQCIRSKGENQPPDQIFSILLKLLHGLFLVHSEVSALP